MSVEGIATALVIIVVVLLVFLLALFITKER